MPMRGGTSKAPILMRKGVSKSYFTSDVPPLPLLGSKQQKRFPQKDLTLEQSQKLPVKARFRSLIENHPRSPSDVR